MPEEEARMLYRSRSSVPLIIEPDKVSAEDMKKGVVLLILY
jgi:hypothetical protein